MKAITSRRATGFVAIRDINPRADTHLLVLPERHVDTFRDVGEFPADEAKRMLDFVAETAKQAGLEDYRVLVNVGEGGGQTIFHLHWHILGGRVKGLPRERRSPAACSCLSAHRTRCAR